MFEARFPGSLMPQILKVLIRHGRRFSALVAIAAVIPFGAAPVLAQTMVTEARPGPTAVRSGPLHVVTSSISRVLTIARAQPADATESGKRRAKIRLKTEDFGVLCNGITVDTTKLQAALNAAAGRVLQVQAGTCLVDAALTVASNTTLSGHGPGTSIIKAAATMTAYAPTAAWGGPTYILLTNDTYGGTGNSGITVRDLGFVAPAPGASTHVIHFRNSHGDRIENVYTLNGNDGIAHTKSTNYVVTGCQTTNAGNVGIDQWDGSSDGTIINNRVIGPGDATTSSMGIVITGIDAFGASAPVTRFKVENNFVSGVFTIGIWMQGGTGTAGITDSVVIGNTISNIPTYYGIRVSEGHNIAVIGNTISSTGSSGINVVTETTFGVSYSSIIGNTISGAGGSLGEAAIDIFGASTHNVVAGNVINGSAYSYGIWLSVGADNNQVAHNVFATGTSGRVLNSGANNSIIDTQGAGSPWFNVNAYVAMGNGGR